jgi:predicted RNase H-like nuclease (RuvC/YqgF family)
MIQDFIIEYKKELENLKRQNRILLRKLENQRRNKLRLKNNLNQIIKDKDLEINKLTLENKNTLENKEVEINNLKKELSIFDSCWEWDNLDSSEIID